MGSQEGQSVLPGRTDRPAPPPLPFLLLWLSLYIFTPECRAARRVIVLWALLEVFVLCSKLNLRFLHLRSHNSITFKVTLRRAQSSPVQLSSAGWSSVLVSPAQSADSRQWCSSGNTLAEVNQGLEWKGIGHSSGGVGGGLQWIAHLSLEIEPVRTHMNTHTLFPALKTRGPETEQQSEPWPSGSSLDEVHLSRLSPLRSEASLSPPPPRPPLALCDWLFIILIPSLSQSGDQQSVSLPSSLSSPSPPSLPLPWGCRSTCLPRISLILWLDSLFPLPGL